MTVWALLILEIPNKRPLLVTGNDDIKQTQKIQGTKS